MPFEEKQLTEEDVLAAKEQGATREEVVSVVKTEEQLAKVEAVYDAEVENFSTIEVDSGGLTPEELAWEPMVVAQAAQNSYTQDSASEMATYMLMAQGATSSPTVRERHTEIADALLAGGEAGMDILLQQIQHLEDTASQDAINNILLDKDIDIEQRTEAVTSVLRNKKEVTQSNIREEAAIQQMVKQEPSSPEELARYDAALAGLDRELAADSVLQDEVRKALRQLDFGAPETRYDISTFTGLMQRAGATLSSVVGFLAPTSLHKVNITIYEEVFGEIPAKAILPGELLPALRDGIMEREGTERLEFGRKVLNAIKNNSGYLDHNTLIERDRLNVIFEEVLNGKTPEEDVDWNRWIEDAVGALDLVGAGQMVRGGWKGIKALPAFSPASTLNKVDPKEASRMLALALEDESIARALGMTKAQVYMHTVPSPKDTVVQVTVDSIVPDLLKLKKEGEGILRLRSTSVNYTDAEKVAASARVESAIKESVGGSYRPTMSEIVPAHDGMDVRMVLGHNEHIGYQNITAVDNAMEEVFGKGFTDYTVMWKNPNTGVLEPFNKEAFKAATKDMLPEEIADLGGWYDMYAKVNHKYEYNLGMMDSNKLFGDISVSTGTFINRFTADADARLSEFVNKIGISAFKSGRQISNRMNQMINDRLRVLDTNGKIKVMRFVEQGSEESKVFSVDDLIVMGATPDEIRAYNAVRHSQDIAYQMDDARLISNLKAKDAKQVHYKDGDLEYVNYATPLEESGAKTTVKFAYNPATDSIDELTADAIEAIYKSGGSVGRFADGVESVGKSSSKYVIINPTNKTTLKTVPARGVLKYIPGYVTRLNKENYYIVRTSDSVVDGATEARTSTVHVASSSKEAKAAVASLSKTAKEGESYTFRLDTALQDPTSRSNFEWDVFRNSGRLKLGRRGERLEHFSGKKSEIADSVESLLVGNQVTAVRVAHSDAVSSLKQRVVNEHAAFMPKSPETSVPFFPEDMRGHIQHLKTTTNVPKNIEDSMIAMADYIRAIEGIDDPSKTSWRKLMVGLGERLDDTYFGDKISGAAYWAARHNPMNFASGVAFNTLLVLQPARQILLGGTQHTLLAGLEPKYFATSLYPNSTGMALGLATMDRPEAWKNSGKIVAKMLGMKERDARKFIDNFRNSGLIDVIDSHSFARDGMVNLSTALHVNIAKQSVDRVLDATKLPFVALKKVGFDAGESANKMMSYLIAAERYRGKNPGANVTSKKAADWISAEAESLALNMTQVGKFGYQDGWLKLATQFLSFQHKAIGQFMPQMLGGSRRYTAAEKSRMAFMQLGLWGVEGFGLKEVWEWYRDKEGLELSPAEQALIEDGMMETTFNAILNSYSDEDSHVDFGSTLAPAGGAYSSFYGIMYNLLNVNIPEFLTGASSSAYTKFADAAGMVKHIYQRPDMNTSDQIIAGIKSVSSIAGQYSKYTQMKLAMNIGHIVDSNGDPVVAATYNEILMKGVFGIGPEAESDYYALMQSEMGKFSSKDVHDSHVEDAAKLYDRMSRLAILMADEAPETIDDAYYARLNSAIGAEASIWLSWDANDAYAIQEEFRKLLNRNEMSSVKGDKLVEKLTGLILKGHKGQDTEYFINKLNNADFISPERREVLQDLYDRMNSSDASIEEHAEKMRNMYGEE